jgi:hypothetical protein
MLSLGELVFNDKPSKFNKELLDYINRHISEIVIKGRIKFKITITRPHELDKLRSRGIKKLPSLILDKKIYAGVPEIIDILGRRVKTSKQTAANKSDDEFMHDYQSTAILRDVKRGSDDKIIGFIDDVDETYDPTAAIMAESKRRADMNKRGGDKSAPDVEYQPIRKQSQQKQGLSHSDETENDDDMMMQLMDKNGC